MASFSHYELKYNLNMIEVVAIQLSLAWCLAADKAEAVHVCLMTWLVQVDCFKVHTWQQYLAEPL